MEIRLSRHAKRRIKLYNIPETVIYEILKENEFSSEGKYEIIQNVSGLELPVKIVIQGERTTVITAYPLKKGRKNESDI